MTSKLKTDVLETVSGSGTIALTNQLSGMTSASMPSGSVLQVISTSSAAALSTSSTTFVDLLTLNITPQFSNSKILIQFNSSLGYQNVGSLAFYTHVTITRNTTNLGHSTEGFSGNYLHSVSYDDYGISHNCHYLDSPSTTSQITYKIQARVGSSNVAAVFGLKGIDSLTLTEIKG